MKKNLRIIKGIILYPFKSLYFRLSGGMDKYHSLQIRADSRAKEKAFYRSLFLSSLTGTSNINLKR